MLHFEQYMQMAVINQLTAVKKNIIRKVIADATSVAAAESHDACCAAI